MLENLNSISAKTPVASFKNTTWRWSVEQFCFQFCLTDSFCCVVWCCYDNRLQNRSRLTIFFSSLVSAFSEFLFPVVFTSFKPFLLREKRVPPKLVIIRRLGFQTPFFTQIKTSSFHSLFFVSVPFFRWQNIKNFKKLNFLLIRALIRSFFLSLVSKKAYRPTTYFASGEWNLPTWFLNILLEILVLTSSLSYI